MIAFGFWGKRRATTESDFLVAGRRLGPVLYSGTMAAIVLGGASTIGGGGLGYPYGLSRTWAVVDLRGAGRYVFVHAPVFRPVLHQARGFLPLPPAGGARARGRVRGPPAAGALAHDHRRRHDRHLLRRVHVRAAHRAGHLAARVH